MISNNKRYILTTILLIGFFTFGCATDGAVDRRNVETTISIQHGTVKDIEQVELKSEAAKGAIIGGTIGLLAVSGSTAEHVGGAIGGAVAGALITRAFEGSNKANAYTVRLNNGSEVKVITDDKYIEAGDCVAVETGKTTNIRRVSQVLCKPSKPHQAVDAELHEKHQEEAWECHEAKKQLLKAKTEDEIDALLRKVKVLCEQ